MPKESMQSRRERPLWSLRDRFLRQKTQRQLGLTAVLIEKFQDSLADHLGSRNVVGGWRPQGPEFWRGLPPEGPERTKCAENTDETVRNVGVPCAPG